VKLETGPRVTGMPGNTETPEDQAVFVMGRLEEAGVPMARRNYAAGELLHASGDPDRYLGFLLEGQVRVYKTYGACKEATVALLAESGVFGEPSLQPSGGHRDCAEALTDCKVARVSKDVLKRHVSRDSACALALMVAFCKWAQQREQVVALLLPRGVKSRLAALLLSLADGFGEEAEPGVAIGMRLTHQRLAEMVACTREAVSKEMAIFEREGHIETRNSERRIVLLDRRRLGELAA
jgi:CRP/FNR family transcriptional regulator, global nitrogen regulator